jgi:hypothetical protein
VANDERADAIDAHLQSAAGLAGLLSEELGKHGAVVLPEDLLLRLVYTTALTRVVLSFDDDTRVAVDAFHAYHDLRDASDG